MLKPVCLQHFAHLKCARTDFVRMKRCAHEPSVPSRVWLTQNAALKSSPPAHSSHLRALDELLKSDHVDARSSRSPKITIGPVAIIPTDMAQCGRFGDLKDEGGSINLTATLISTRDLRERINSAPSMSSGRSNQRRCGSRLLHAIAPSAICACRSTLHRHPRRADEIARLRLSSLWRVAPGNATTSDVV